jgi:hypothetical protein
MSRADAVLFATQRALMHIVMIRFMPARLVAWLFSDTL